MTQAFVDGVKLDTTILDKLTAEMLPRASKVVMGYGLKIMAEAAMGAPVDTGALRSSIVSESHADGPLLFIVQDGVEYGVFVEFGTSRQAAQPFFIPAIENNRNGFENAMMDLFR